MDIRNTSSICEQARPHYYDLLFGRNMEFVPDYITFHVQQCWYCQKQIDELDRILSSEAVMEADTELTDSTAITDVLWLHLAYVDEPVTCEIVKPFLPGMLIPALEVRVPTPITAHIDKCAPCAHDLELLRNLKLTRQQLRRLSEFFTEKSVGCLYADAEKQKTARLVAAGDWGNLDAKTLRHMCKCPICSGMVQDQRQKMLEDLKNRNGDIIPCEAILAGGFFDFVFPYGLDPTDDQYSGFRRIFASHIADCPDCVSKMQLLHDLVYQVVERPDSGVVTVFSKETAAVAGPLEECDIAYDGFPIKIDVVPQTEPAEQPQAAAVVNFAKMAKKRKRLSLSFKLKAGVAAAIFLAVGLSTFFYRTATAELTPGEKMRSALRNTTNIHKMQFAPGREKPFQEQWVSRKSGIFRIVDKRYSAIYDIHKKIAKTKYFDTGEVEIRSLAGEDLAVAKKNIMGETLHQFLTDTRMTEWSQLNSADLPDIPAGVEVYERNWQKDLSEVSPGLVELNKFRIFVDRETFLPRRTESYFRLSDENDFKLTSFYVYEYPSDEQMESILDFGF